MTSLIKLFILLTYLLTPVALGYSANKVWFTFLENGLYRVSVNYTIPELKEFREARVEFQSRKRAETYYWHLIRGGEFYLGPDNTIEFKQNPQGPKPW